MTNTPTPTDEDRELKLDDAVSKLVEVHRRLLGCFTSPTGIALPRRPRWLEPKMSDCDAVLGGMLELERAKARLESLLSDRAKLEEALRGIQDRIEIAAGWINDATPRWDDEDSPDGVGTITDYVLKDVRAALNRSADRAT